MKKEGLQRTLVLVVLLSLFSFIFILYQTSALTSGTNANATLAIYDDTDSLIRLSGSNVRFFANYTNSSAAPLNATNGGVCNVSYNFTGTYGSFVAMTYNATSRFWESNRTFTAKGPHTFNVSCTSTYGNITLVDAFSITNTAPVINVTAGGTYIDIDGNTETIDYWVCAEDVLCIYNFTANMSDPDTNDNLTFGYNANANTTLTNFTLNNWTGVLTINVTDGVNTGLKQIELTVRDTESQTIAGILQINISSSNDAPLFTNLANQSILGDGTPFEYTITTSDEESNAPYGFNITFLSCTTASWSTRNSTNCELFNSTHYTLNLTAGTIALNFSPTRNDVGSYLINFTVYDSLNATRHSINNFTIENVNLAPYFRYACDNERNTTEGNPFICYINASDLDETGNLTFSSDRAWFTFSPSLAVVNATTEFNGTGVANFTPGDAQVGNWSVNVTVTDSIGKSNSTTFYFSVANLNDSVQIVSIENKTAYTTNNYTIFFNATDDDLLIADKSIYNESISFTSNESWVRVSAYRLLSDTNIAVGNITFDPNTAPGTGERNFSINITAQDANNFSRSTTFFLITISANSPPVWNSTMNTTFTITEGGTLYVNLSRDVTDAEEDTLSFSYSNDTSFPSLSITSAGIINFSVDDSDIGQHLITVNVSDGAISVSQLINITVYNTNDQPFVETPLTVTNATITASSNITAIQGNVTVINVFVQDNDFRIPSVQKQFYNESITITPAIEGPNTTLLSFVTDNSFPTLSNPNRSLLVATFTPVKSDSGSYNVTLNISDRTNASLLFRFNLTIVAVNSPPSFDSLDNQTLAVNSSFYYDINTTDTDDGNDSTGNMTYTFSFANGIAFLNASTFNRTSGVINVSFNISQGGFYTLNFSVNDSTGRTNSGFMSFFVYDYPIILSPENTTIFNLTENTSTLLTLSANHTIGTNLTYVFYLGDERYAANLSANASSVSWLFTPNLTDETYGRLTNLTVVVRNSLFTQLNTSRTWSVNITHGNAPVVLVDTFPDSQTTTDQVITFNLSTYFSDLDFTDGHYNQSLNFTFATNATNGTSLITVSLNASTGLITFSSSSAVSETFNITASDLNGTILMTNATSNAFEIIFTVASSSGGSSGGGGGGGGGSSREKIVTLKLLMPGSITIRNKESLALPITVSNTGTTVLKGIDLRYILSSELGSLPGVKASLDTTYIATLAPKQKLNVTFRLDVSTNVSGTYEVTINGTVKDPAISDSSKLFITIGEFETLAQRVLFTEELVVSNPECLELKELIDEAKAYITTGEVSKAEIALTDALEGCKKLLAQEARPRERTRIEVQLLGSLLIGTAAALFLGILFYVYRAIKLHRTLLGR